LSYDPRRSAVFAETYRKYLLDLSKFDLSFVGKKLGCEMQGSELVMPFFGRPYRISSNGIFEPGGRSSDLSLCVVLCQYLFHNSREISPQTGWASFKDFKNAQPLVGSFAANVERMVTDHFAGRSTALSEACRRLGGRAFDQDLSYDLCMLFDALPRFPALFLFNDADEEFPAACRVLFRADADQRMDMESLAILGMLFAARLVHMDRRAGQRE
jgi:hypothetical protein